MKESQGEAIYVIGTGGKSQDMIYSFKIFVKELKSFIAVVIITF